MLKVSKHITYADAIRSSVAQKHSIKNYFTPKQLTNMSVLAENVYEPLVKHFKQPIRITSFFRSRELNNLIGGSSSSQHMANNGAAIDLDVDGNTGVSNLQLFKYIKDNLDYDQLILEDIKPDGSIGWVHVGYKSKGNRRQVLTMVFKEGKVTYEQYKDK